MPLAEALRAARNAKLDLVQVAGIACCCQMLVTLIPTVYGALLKSAVSGTDHWIHAVKEMLVIAPSILEKAHAGRFVSVPASQDQPYSATSAQPQLL